MSVARTALAAAVVLAGGFGCGSSNVPTPLPPPAACDQAPDPAATPADISGVYRYRSLTYALRGNIAFTQTGARVSVGGITYDNADDRPLMGEADLVGNRLDVVLVPTNGDTDYRADVAFVFDQQATSFCLVSFSDTNDDFGGAQSYFGERL
jgi:hypothetical protein